MTPANVIAVPPEDAHPL